MSNDSHQQGQPPPPPWTSGQPSYPPSTQYSAPPSTQPVYQYPPAPGMATVHQPVQHHPQPDAYHGYPPPPHAAYQRPPEMYAQPAPQPPVVYQAAAPRQRTAIACRYCRRRKIRCSGFETSQDGRCSNCVRFNQDCMFTPVSSQTQAFVPAHAVYPHVRPGPQGVPRVGGRPGEALMLYGAHGQPLPPQPPQQPPHMPEHTLPPPHGMYQQPYGRPGEVPPPHASLAQPMLQDPHQAQDRRESGAPYPYSEAPTLPPVSGPTAGAGHYYPPQDTRRLSSHSSYSYDPAAPPPGTSAPDPSLRLPVLQPQNVPGARESGPTPPPAQTPGPGRGGLSVRDMLSPGDAQSTRSSTDSDMLNALNRRGLSK